MQRLRRRLRGVAAALGSALGLLATGALAADPPSVMIVVDGTGSMKGLLDPKARPAKTKLAAVQDGLRAALATVGSQTKV
jgi:hypothetical protein